MLRLKKRRPTVSEASGSDQIQANVSAFMSSTRSAIDEFGFSQPKAENRDCTKILLDIAEESADWFAPLKAVLGGVNALIKHYEVSVKSIGHHTQLTLVARRN
jgi:hypothetical protein